MREIKFRAWDGHRMQTDFTLDAEDGMPRLVVYSIHGSPGDPVPQFKVMQFTGLHDKDEKEIYEGDVLHLQWLRNYRGVVEFRNGAFCMIDFSKEIVCRNLGDIISGDVRVIGNIYQHAELLK